MLQHLMGTQETAECGIVVAGHLKLEQSKIISSKMDIVGRFTTWIGAKL